ncbi:MAG TPA: response regulator [Blastocatellia bacterium]
MVRQSDLALRPARVLAVDDDRYITRLLEFILTKHGYKVATANCAEKALAMIDEFQPDSILLDLGLPGMSGIEAIRLLRQDHKYARLPIMVLSARSFEHIPDELKDAGATDLWAKPIAPSTLLSRLKDFGIPPDVEDRPNK